MCIGSRYANDVNYKLVPNTYIIITDSEQNGLCYKNLIDFVLEIYMNRNTVVCFKINQKNDQFHCKTRRHNWCEYQHIVRQ